MYIFQTHFFIYELIYLKEYKILSKLLQLSKEYYNIIQPILKRYKPKFYDLPILQQYISKWTGNYKIDKSFIYNDQLLQKYDIKLNSVKEIAEYNIYLIKNTYEGSKRICIKDNVMSNVTIYIIDKYGIIRRLPCSYGNCIIVDNKDYVLKRYYNGRSEKKYKFKFVIEDDIVFNREELIKYMTELYSIHIMKKF